MSDDQAMHLSRMTHPLQQSGTAGESTRILCTAATLFAFLATIRGIIIGVVPPSGPVARAVAKALLASFYDFVFVAVLTAAFIAALWICQPNRIASRSIAVIHAIASVAVLLVALVNIENVKMLGGPFTYQWFYYSDFLTSKEAQDAIAFGLTWSSASLSVTLLVALFGISIGLTYGTRHFLQTIASRRSLILIITIPAFIYVSLGVYFVRHTSWQYAKLANPIVAFAMSVFFRDTPAIFLMTTPVGNEDFAIAADHSRAPMSFATRHSAPIRNVLFYVMESVPAEYVGAYGSPYPATLELNERRGSSLVFENIYAHVPDSARSLASILLSTYGRVNYSALTRENPDIDLESLSSELKDHGYRTGLFYGSDLHFARQEEFLSYRKIDVVQDWRTRNCIPLASPEDRRAYGSGDQCTARAFVEWMRKVPSTPFFAILWTMQTHWPYFISSGEIDFHVDEPSLNRFLNALREGDEALGEILRALEEDGIADSTLVVVVGDHGEAFGRHDGWGHASNIYEENVHVPLILINRALFDGGTNPVVGGLIDLAPTILYLLDMPAPDHWQGISLFDSHRSPRVYLFSHNTNLMFGYREGDQKYILNATEDRYEVYDLVVDPHESNNLATGAPTERLAIQ